MGLATKVISVEDWNEQVNSLCGKHRKHTNESNWINQKILRGILSPFIRRVFEGRSRRTANCWLNDRLFEGVTAFAEKRKAQFIGK